MASIKGLALKHREIVDRLEGRLGRVHARQRIGIEQDHEAQAFGQGLNFFHIENFLLAPSAIKGALWLAGLYRRARKNASQVELRHNIIASPWLPPAFDGFTILHLSDLHTDMSRPAMDRLVELVAGLDYDICVLTGDYRGETYGPFEAALKGVSFVHAHLKGPVYGVLGNHDTILMLPALEDMGIRMLLNEAETIVRQGQQIYLAGIDDAHFFRVDNIEKAAAGIPPGAYSILLSHTPEIYRQAAHAGFSALLSGHTHGGQICLPGAIPITLDSALPRAFGSGAWKYNEMAGYTSVGAGSSVVAVRLNCAPEITLHRLERSAPPIAVSSR
ncbi:metallophosphoesterase [Methylocapsa aurea]|uniref:metallophosphoesterase n=1 Tax=Methylocapsa aurea TaxID=663610 RepID=UPI000690F6E0|nr:metallophosphoesterase [Methylocapsa aurea]